MGQAIFLEGDRVGVHPDADRDQLIRASGDVPTDYLLALL